MRWKMNFLFTFAVALVMALSLSHTAYADTVDDTSDTEKGSTTGSNVYYFSYYYSSSLDAIYLDVTTKNGNKDHTYTSASDTTVISSQNPVCSVSMDTALANLISQGGHTSCSVESLKSDLNTLGYYDNGNGIWISSDASAYLTYVSVSNMASITTYTLTYSPNGASGTSYTQSITYGESYTTKSTSTYTRSGYYISSWNTNPSGSGTSKDTYKTYTYGWTSDITLYAQWTGRPYTVTYKANGGTGSDVTQDVTYGSSFTTKSKSTFSRSGYYISSWNTASDGSGTTYSVSQAYTYSTVGNLTLYAQWSPNPYTITYKANGGSGSDVTQDVTYNTSFTTKSRSGAGFTRTGYSFTGWNTNSGGSGTSYGASRSYTYSTSGNLTLYAQWTDDISPTGSITATPNSWSSGNGTVSVTAQDTGSGLASVVIKRYSYRTGSWTTVSTTNYNGTTSSQSVSYSQTSEGIFYYKAVITDKAGNSYEVSSSVVYLDHSDPTATVTVSDTDWTNTAPTISVSATDYLTGTSYTGSGVKSVVIKNSSGKVVASDSNSSASTLSTRTKTASTSYTLTKAYEGTYTWTITVTDFVDKTYSTTVTTKYDCTKPVIVGTEETTISSSGVVTSAYMVNNIISQSVNDYASNSSNSPNAVSGLKSVIVYKVTNGSRTILSRQSFSTAGETLYYEYYRELPTSEKTVDYYLIIATDYAGNIAQKKLVSKQSTLVRFRTSIDRSSYR